MLKAHKEGGRIGPISCTPLGRRLHAAALLQKTILQDVPSSAAATAFLYEIPSEERHG